jgi:hypothetical protein
MARQSGGTQSRAYVAREGWCNTWTLRVLGVRDDDADQPPALVVEDLPGWATSAAG